MERDLYPRRWGLGPQATEKKKLKADGKLDKFGRVNAETPAKWKDSYTDYSAAADASNGEAPAPIEAAPASLPTAVAPPVLAQSAEEPAEEKKRKSKHDGETPEERAERKRRKKEKKAKRASKGAAEEDDSD